MLHFHIDFLHFPTFRHLAGKCLTTLHGRQDFPDFWPAYRTFPEMQLVSISDDQRAPIADADFAGTIHHGLPRDLIPFSAGGGDYLAFIGRMSPGKAARPGDRDRARRAACKLKIAAKVDRADRAYFESEIKPLLDDPLIEFVGEIGDADKPAFLGGARALLFPIDWPEPFGLVMIEAMAAGTPVIAWRCGSTAEVIEHGRSGFLVEDVEEARGRGRGGAAASPRRRPRRVRGTASPPTGWRATMSRLYERLIARRVSPPCSERTLIAAAGR